MRIASRVSDAEPALVRVAGKHCESGDIVVDADYLPGDVTPGDLLAVAATGAYCWSLASNYNYLGRPPVVAVRDGTSRILIHGETEADLLRTTRHWAAATTSERTRMIDYRTLRVALLGAGSVGSPGRRPAARALRRARPAGRRAPRAVGHRRPRPRDRSRAPASRSELLTTDAEELIVGADIVIELMGGIEPAREHILLALRSGADVITGNKALLATHGPELFDLAQQVGAQLYYEAAVGGAIPIIRPLRDSLAGDRVQRILGIVNGTTNYILDRMDPKGDSLESALAAATELGYAEADPTGDIEGYDAAQKAAILAGLAFHTTVPIESVHREGITGVRRGGRRPPARPDTWSSCSPICERITDRRDRRRGSERPRLPGPHAR